MGDSFIGREEELRRLTGELELAGRGRSRVVLLTGEPGIGKTRLLTEFGAVAASQSRYLSGRGSPLGTNAPFSVVAEAVEGWLRHLDPTQVLRLCGPRASDLAAVFPSVEVALAGVQPPAPSRLRVMEAIVFLFEALATDQMLVISFDDLHQADPSTWEFINYLGRNPAAAPLLVVCATRLEALAALPDFAVLVGSLVKDGLTAEVRLDALAEDEVAALARAVLGESRAQHELTSWLFRRSRGNPLFARALLNDLLVNEHPTPVASGVKERVRVLTASLESRALSALELLSVLGHSIPERSITRLYSPEEALTLDDLVVAGFVTRTGADGGPAYDFAHPLIQEAVYENLGAVRRRDLHRRIAAALDDQPLAVRAYHAARGATVGDQEALTIILAAARGAEHNHAYREALTYLQSALDLVRADGVEQRRALLDEIVWQAGLAGDHTVGLPALDGLEPLVGDDPLSLGTILMRRSSFLATDVGDLSAAGTAIQRAIDLFATIGADERIAAAMNELAWIRGEAGDPAAQVEGSRAALQIAEQRGDATTILHCLGASGHGMAIIGRFGEAEVALTRGQQAARESGDEAQLGWFTGVLGDLYLCWGRLDEAQRVFDAFLARGPSVSDVTYDMRCRTNWFAGRWAEALEDCRMVQALNPTAPSIHSAFALSVGALLETLMGRPDSARTYMAQADRAYRGRDFYWFSAWHDWAAGNVLRHSGEPVAALARLHSAATQLRRLAAAPIEVQVLPDLVEAAVEAGNVAAAETAAEWLAEIATSVGTPFAAAAAQFGAGVVGMARGKRADAARQFDYAAREFAEVGAPFLRARALEHLGATVTGAASLEALDAAARLYAVLPAPEHERRAIAALRAAGPAGQRAAQGIGRLTPREQEIAALARRGLTTPAIAAQLVLGERTIETHLAHIYAKLGVTGRGELAGREGGATPSIRR